MQILPFAEANLNDLPTLQPPDWPDLRISYRYYLKHLDFCGPIKIVIDDKVVGIGTTLIHKEVVWLAHIVVHPEYRNRGLGSIITKSLIDSIKRDTYKTISLIATDLGKPVYAKIGFEIVGEYAFLKNENQTTSELISEKIKSTEQKHFEEILKLDKKACGEDRSNHLSEFFPDSYVYLEDKIVRGYYLPNFIDGLIIAENSIAGIELMKLRNQTHTIACLPVENKIALKFLEENNFLQFRTAKRMSMGEKINWQPEKFYNRVSGSLG